MRGWVGVFSAAALFFSISFASLGFASESPGCGERVVALEEFQRLFAAEFSRYPDLTHYSQKLSTRLLLTDGLRPETRAYLAQGGDPLKMGDASLLSAVAGLYRKAIETSPLKEDRKAKLLLALERAFEELSRGSFELPPPPPPDVTSGKPSSGGGTPRSEEALADLVFKDMVFKRCVARSAILFVVSNLINTAGALQAKWTEYAGEDTSLLEGITSTALRENAMKDPEFRHNVTWNAILMVAMGAFSCLRSQEMGKRLLMAMSAVVSASGQYLSNGYIEWDQTLLDVLFVRYLSYNKTQIAFRWAEGYQRSRLPAPRLVESGIQVISEGVGGFLYPRAVRAKNLLFKAWE